MASFEPKVDGLDGLDADLKKLGRLTNEDAWTILTPAADLLKEKFMEKIRSIFRQHTGKLAASIKDMKKAADGPSILIYPQGAHHQYRSRKSGGSKTASASEVGFVLEYGDSRHAARHWMEGTVTEQESALGEKFQEGFDKLCDEKGIP